MNKQTEKKIAVIGVGGVGGYLAGTLAHTYSRVTVVARGARKESIERKGLILHSDCQGEIVARPKQVVSDLREAGEQDVIFICVKNYSLQEVCEGMQDLVGEETIIVPVMNGAQPGELTRSCLGRGIVLDALIYIVSYADRDYSIVQRDPIAQVQLGCTQAGEREQQAAALVCEILTHAGIDAVIPENIEVAVWKKYAFNCAYNVLTAYYMEDTGYIRSNAERLEQFRSLLKEAIAVAGAKGIVLPQEYYEQQMHRLCRELSDSASSSLKRDLEAGRRNELDTFSGYLVREAARLGVEVPVSEEMYRALAIR